MQNSKKTTNYTKQRSALANFTFILVKLANVERCFV